MIAIFTSPLFYLFLTLGIYCLFAFLAKKTKSALLNPLLWTGIFIIGYIVLIVFIEKGEVNENNLIEANKTFSNGTYILNLLVAPATVCLALPVYENRHLIKEHWLPILVGTIVGCAVSMGSAYLLSLAFGIEADIAKLLLPKGVTTAIATEIASMFGMGSKASILISCVVITGIVGALLGPLLSKLLRIENDVAKGMAYGCASHAIGTTKALSISPTAGALSSLAIVTSGIFTVLVCLVISFF